MYISSTIFNNYKREIDFKIFLLLIKMLSNFYKHKHIRLTWRKHLFKNARKYEFEFFTTALLMNKSTKNQYFLRIIARAVFIASSC